ncbi:MAG: DUF2935 domain-containing protein [Alicyclobacillus sp.]|nr:DUF2935 domain-containing protein [Alicyclobacillus sp.]
MTNRNLPGSAGAEHQFWLQVLGDHARFIHDALSPRETAEIARARQFIDRLDALLAEARRVPSHSAAGLAQAAHADARRLREFKLHLLRRHLRDEIHIQMSPTFLNHMINENEEYLRILPHLEAGRQPPARHPVHHHLLWLLDAAGHASILAGVLDSVEKDVLAKSRRFERHFEALYLKAVETAGYLRTRLAEFPALQRLNQQAALEICLFRTFLDEVRELELSDALLGAVNALMPDHMAREECYYLHQLAASGDGVTAPDCDPAQPRVGD